MSGKKKILILEDVKPLSLLYKYHLQNDFEVLTAENFTDFKNTLEEQEISLVIMDYALPGECSTTIMNFIRSQYSHLPKILISSHIQTYNLDTLYKSDFQHIIDKPLDNLSLLNKMVVDEVY